VVGLFADADAVWSQLIATVAAALIATLCAVAWRTMRAVQRMNDHVLPHFVPPTPEEIRSGQPDNTMPARMGRMEVRLSTHLVEERADGIELAATLAKGTERMQALEDGQAAIKDQLTDTVRKLGAGNPEWRDDDVHRSAADEQATA
jgi:hypothetical protein